MLNFLCLHTPEQTAQHAEPRKCTKWQLLQMYQPSPPVKAVSTTECDAAFWREVLGSIALSQLQSATQTCT